MFAEDEINILVLVLDVNPVWWGQQAQREPKVMCCVLLHTSFTSLITLFKDYPYSLLK